MNREGHQMVRYADDRVILCPDAESAARVLQSLREWMASAGLTLHPEKTKIVDMGQPKAHFDVARIGLRKSGGLSPGVGSWDTGSGAGKPTGACSASSGPKA